MHYTVLYENNKINVHNSLIRIIKNVLKGTRFKTDNNNKHNLTLP